MKLATKETAPRFFPDIRTWKKMLCYKDDFSLNKPLPSITLFYYKEKPKNFKLKLLFNGQHWL